MDSHSKEIAEMIRTGEYYEQSRAWYGVKYIGPISERTFFLIVAGLASLIVLFSAIAVALFLPLSERKPIIISNSRIDETIPHVEKIGKGANSNRALMQFFVASYVDKRESYALELYEGSSNFIKYKSDEATYQRYLADYGLNNKQSPAAILGTVGKRVVTLNSININYNAEPKTATVKFSTDVTGYNQPFHADWTAILQFHYTNLQMEEVKDPTTGETVYETKDPQFQVVKYELTQKP